MSSIIASLGVQDYIALAVIAVSVISAVLYLKKRRKKGGCGNCTGCSGCSGCMLSDKCQNQKENDNYGTEDQLSDKTGKNLEKP